MSGLRAAYSGPWAAGCGLRAAGWGPRAAYCVLRAVCCVGSLWSGLVVAQDVPELTEASQISVVTILPGDPLYSSFGHTAIRVRDDSAGFDVGYNYGTFDFDDEGFYLKFLQGKLDYRLARDRFDDMLYSYQLEHRPVIEQRLLLPLEKRRLLFSLLETNYLPENRAYRYEFLFDNCSTRPRDVIEAAWDYRIQGSPGEDPLSFRDLIDAYLVDKPWTRFGIDLALGAATDHAATPRQRMFLPDEFLAGLDAARSPDGERLVAAPDTLFWGDGYQRLTGASPWPAIVGWLLLVLLTVASIYATRTDGLVWVRRLDGAIFTLAGIAGIVLALLWFATEHTVPKSNWNILWALPTHVIPGGIFLAARKPKWIKPYAALSMAAVLVTFVAWSWIPQEINPWFIPYMGVLLLRSAFLIRGT